MDICRLLNDVDLVHADDDLAHTDVDLVEADLVDADTAESSELRVGKWTTEEVRYATSLVKHFVAGTLAIPSGTSLRSFLAHKLHCSAMRVSTKLATDALGGFTSTRKLGLKRFFPMEGLSPAQRDHVARELQRLRADFVRVANIDESEMDEPTSRSSLHSSASSTSTSDDEADAPWRIGSWSHEEQLYACALIDGFMRGRVNVAQGTTLRAYLSQRLCCNPMRISKKLATGKMASTNIPKRLGSVTYHIQATDAATVSTTEHSLERLRLKCFPTAPQHIQEPLPRAPIQMPSPLWHAHNYASYLPYDGMTSRDDSSLHVGIKRKLWLPQPASGYSLPPLLSSFDKRPRLVSNPFC